jgi:hypothetical protein
MLARDVRRIVLTDMSSFYLIPDQLQQGFTNGATALW